MKLKRFNQTTACRRLVTKEPTLSFCLKTGQILFNASSVAVFGLTEKNRIEFLQSETDPEDWFVSFASPEGFLLRRLNGGGYSVTSKLTAHTLAKSIGVDILRFRMPIATEKDTDANAFALITRAAKTK